MIQGTVKYVAQGGRFGMISRDDKAPKVFVHVSEVHELGLSELRKGQRFSFELKAADDGRASAKLIALLSPAP